jgi:isopenicillin-N epimerase
MLNAREIFPLDTDVAFLNHGSFGSCPRPVLEFQRQLRDRLERQPVQFLVRDLEPMMDQARAAVAAFVGSRADDLVFVHNATSGVNTVLRSLTFQKGDELLATDHEYNACRNALEFVAERSGAKIVVAHVPFPVQTEAEIMEAVMRKVTARTRLALIDHVTSQTALVMPIGRLVAELSAKSVDTLVDGAHAPGMVPLNLPTLGAAYYTGNCHKWICAPKAVAFLYVRADRQERVRPLTISHGANSLRRDRSRFQIEFGWMGTFDATVALSVPEALRVMEKMMPRGWVGVMAHNHALAIKGRETLCRAWNVEPPCPDDMIGSMASIPIGTRGALAPSTSPLFIDVLQDELLAKHRIEVPIIPWPAFPQRLLRISAQLYNSPEQYEKLGAALAPFFKA